jgi:hypothetical protein
MKTDLFSGASNSNRDSMIGALLIGSRDINMTFFYKSRQLTS